MQFHKKKYFQPCDTVDMYFSSGRDYFNFDVIFSSVQEELDWFERKQRGKKRRPRKQKEEIIEASWFQRHLFTMIMLSVAVGLIAGLFFIAMN